MKALRGLFETTGAVAVAVLLVAGSAKAADEQLRSADHPANRTSTIKYDPTRESLSVFSFAQSVPQAVLDGTRGAGLGVDPAMSGLITNAGNSVSVTGTLNLSNSVASGAFNHVSGLVNVLQNAGNNVSIQNQVYLHLTFGK